METIYIEVEIKEEILRVPVDVEAVWYEDDDGSHPEIVNLSVDNKDLSNEEIALVLAEAKKQEKKITQKLIEISWEMAEAAEEDNF